MYKAELGGKIPSKLRDSEDVLTSHVFGFLDYAPRWVLREYFGRCLGLKIGASKDEKIEFRFWPSYDDRTEPDVVILTNRYYCLFEAKLYSDFGIDRDHADRDQLKRELKGGSAEAAKLGLEFKLITITREPFKRVEKYRQLGMSARLGWIWTNWQKFHSFLTDTRIPEVHRMRTDLIAVLEKSDLIEFRGFAALGEGPQHAAPRLLDTKRRPTEFFRELPFFPTSADSCEPFEFETSQGADHVQDQ